MANKRGNVLIVDDQPELLIAYERIIKKVGYHTYIAENGEKAMQIIKKKDVSLVLLDVVLPDTNGFDIMRILKSDPATEHIFVVLISSKVKSAEKQSEGLESGADGYLAKPINSRELAARIDAFMKHKNTIDELRLSEERFKKLSDKNVDGILIVDVDGIIRFSNPAAENLFYKKKQLLKGISFGLPVVSGEKTEVGISYKGKFDRVAELRVADVAWDSKPMFLVSMHDITEIKQHEKEIKQSLQKADELNKKYARINEELSETIVKVNSYNNQLQQAKAKVEENERKYREIVESIKDGFFVLDGSDFKVSLFNSVAGNILKKKPNKVINHPFFKVFPEFKNSLFQEKFNLALNEQEFIHFELLFEPEKFKNWYDVRIYPGNQVISVFFQVTTERKKIERELTLAKNRAEESDRLKSAFLANMSHEIRTPLNAIMGFSGLLINEDLSEDKKKHFASIIKKSGEQLLHIINDILDISKIESGQLCIDCAWFDATAVLKDVVNKYQFVDIIKKKQVELKVNIPSQVKECYLYNDQARFTQIFDNLLTNALKFTKQGEIEVGLNVFQKATEGKILFYVKDTGIGIPQEQLEIIFERFRQADNNVNHEGTGLGLSIIKGVIKLMNGDIWVTSELGQGTTFFFTVPYKPEDFSQLFLSEDGHLEQTPDFSQFKVFIAEDDLASSLYIEEILDCTNIKTYSAKNGVGLLKLFEITTPDIVLLDIKMPIMDGIETVKEIKKRNNDIPVIAQTAYALNKEKADILNAGFNEYITKPLNQTELFILMSKYLYQ